MFSVYQIHCDIDVDDISIGKGSIVRDTMTHNLQISLQVNGQKTCEIFENVIGSLTLLTEVQTDLGNPL